MNRVKKDYCSKGIHPNWRAWEAKYDMSTIEWKHTGCFCQYCNKPLSETNVRGAGAPRENGYIKLYSESKLTVRNSLRLAYHYKR